MQQSETLAFETVSKSWLDKLGIIGLIDERSTGLKVEKVAFSANGSWFITVNVENSNALVWECGMSKRPRLVHLPDKERIRDLKISNNGSILITRNNGVVDVLRILDDNIVQLLFRDHLQHGPASTVEFDPNNDEVFFSGGLDGIIRQHDMRISNTDRKLFDTQSPHYIPTGTKQFPILQEVGKKIQIIVINSVFPHLIVIGTNDAKVQLFSRDTSNSPPSPTSYLKDDIHELLLLESFCPHHFQHNDCSKMYPTCIKFHPNGKSLLINYHLDHTYEFNIHSITPDTSAIEESNRHKTSHTPWWMKFNKCTSVFEQVDLVKEILYQSNCAKDLNFLSRSVALLSIALELLMEISESANDQGMSTSFMEEITSIRSHSLFLRTRIYLNRKFRGDTHAALNDLKTILTFSPFDVSAKILQCKIHILLNKPAKVVPLIEELEVLLTLNTSSSSLISVKADIQNLKNEVDQLLKGSSHGSIIEDANEETGNMSTNWRTRYEGLTNIDQNQEVAYFGVEGKYIIGCNGNKSIIWDRLTAEIVHLLELRSGSFPMIKTHPTLPISVLSGHQQDYCLFWGLNNLKRAFDESFCQLSSATPTATTTRSSEDDNERLNKLFKYSHIESESANYPKCANIIQEDVMVTKEVGDLHLLCSTSNESRLGYSTSNGEDLQELNQQKEDKMHIEDYSPSYSLSKENLVHPEFISGAVQMFNSIKESRVRHHNSHSIPEENSDYGEIDVANYNNEEIDQNEEDEDDEWLLGSVESSISTTTSTSAYSTSNENSTSTSIILDVYYDAVNDSIEGYPLELKDVIAIEEMLKQNELEVLEYLQKLELIQSQPDAV